MRVVGEDLVGDWVHHLAVIVSCEIEFHQFCRFKSFAIDGIGAVLEEPGQDMVDIEDGASGRAGGGVEGLQRHGAEVEWQAFEGCSICGWFGKAGARAGGERIGGAPFAVGDLILVRRVRKR